MAQKSMGTHISCQMNEKTVSIGRLRSISEIRADSEAVDVTTLDAPGGFRQYAKGLRQAGDVTLDGFLEKDESGQQALRQLYFASDAAPFTITYPDGEKVLFNALVKSFSTGGGEVDSMVKFSAALRITGAVTFA